MKRVLHEILICPVCLPLEIPMKLCVNEIEEDDILSGELICNICGVIYIIKDGIAILSPDTNWQPDRNNKYEDPHVVSSYLWCHYGDLLRDGEWLPAYMNWANLMNESKGFSLDVGSAVGRFTFEMTTKSDFSVGIDTSFAFINIARKIMKERKLVFELKQEGLISTIAELSLPKFIRTDNIEFIVADALALPFPKGLFTKVSSLNIVDKVPFPMKHISEMNRIASINEAQILISDPYSWSHEVSDVKDWLGGKEEGEFRGFGQENIAKIIEGFRGYLENPWKVVDRGTVIWKIRNHRNHFELIKSLYIKAIR